MSTKSTNNLSKNLDQVVADIGQERIKVNFPLSQVTWMKVGGPADLFFVAKSRQDLIDIVNSTNKHKVQLTILGGGSNVLVKDGGIRGVVVQNRSNHISLAGMKGGVKDKKAGISSVKIKAEGGTFVNQLVRYTIDASLSGLEEFLGIPGSVGGAIYNNSHHLDHLIGDYVDKVEVIDLQANIKTYTHDQMNFEYDYSILHKTQEIVLSVIFELKVGDSKDLWKKAEAALKRRRDTQPLELPSSGCMFKNIGKAQAITHNTPNQQTSAGFLIDQAGLKGEKVGGAQISDVHANFIVNTGNATAKDVVTLKNKVKSAVKQKYGVTLEEEVFFIGED